MSMRLITETSYDIGMVTEGAVAGEGKNFFIEGVFLQSEIKNRNGRVYPKNIMDKEVNRYIKEAVNNGNAYGELGHPAGPTINPDRISHRIVSLKEDGNNYIGKALINNNPMGMIARGLMEGGGKLAVSSRGLGSLKSVGGVMQVCEDFMLATAADIVINPSAPDAFVNGIMEGIVYEWSGGLLKEKHLESLQADIDTSVRNKSLNEHQILKIWNKLSSALSQSNK